MKTEDFKRRTIITNTPFPGSKDNDKEKEQEQWTIGLDMGYSAVKGMSQNSYWCFPALAIKIPSDRIELRAPYSTDIKYRDKTGTWAVGDMAFGEATSGEVIISDSELNRERFYSQSFHVQAAVGIALGLRVNSFGNPNGKEIVIQTGLPPKYKSFETEDSLRDGIEGNYDFELKIGKADWKKFNFNIKRENIYIMPQPLGSLVSISVLKNGEKSPNAPTYFGSDLIVVDPGYGTVDTFLIHNGVNREESNETFNNLGMSEVFKRTCRTISDKYRRTTTTHELEARLTEGNLKIVNKKEMTSQMFDFSELLYKNSRDVCKEVIEQLKATYNYFEKIDYIVVTGGTYEAWKDIFAETFSSMSSLELIPANINDTSMSNIFSNVRGYYFFRLNTK